MRKPWSDARAERMLGAVACLVLVTIAGMVAFVFAKAWPSFAHNGLGWFLPPEGGVTVDDQMLDIFNSPAKPEDYVYELGAWAMIWGTLLTTGGALLVGVVLSVLASVFLVEFAPDPVKRVLAPTVRLLAAVPSVVYGLIGILVLVPFIGNHLTSMQRKEDVIFVVQLSGTSVLAGVAILTVMIVPIMVAIMSDALRAVPRAWTEGAAALGVNRWRATWTVSLRAARPALIAAVVLAAARALGEAIMLAMVSGSVGFAPNPLDGLTFFLEPTRPLAATIVDNAEGLSVRPFGETIYAFAAVLLVSTFFLSLAGWAAKQPLKKYGTAG